MGKLLAGAAMRKITPPPELLERLRTPREDYQGVHSDCWGRVIVVSDGERKIALLGSDTGEFQNTVATEKALREKFGFEENGCIFSATHCHEIPQALLKEGGDLRFMGPIPAIADAQDEFAKWMLQQFVDAAEEAVANLRPARMGVNKGSSYINCSRDLPTPVGGVQSNNFKGTSDHDLLVIKFEDLETGEPIGVWVNHATHSNYMCWNLYNGDYPMINCDVGGSISQFVEKALKCGRKAPVIWSIGAAGDQNPITRSSWRIVRVNDDGDYEMEQVYFGYQDDLLQLENLVGTQGLEIMELIGSMTDWTEDFDFAAADTWRSIPRRKSYNQLKIHPMCGETPEKVPAEGTVDYHFRLVKFNEVAFIHFNSESYSGLGLLAKRLIPAKYVSVNELTFGCVGYIPDVSMEWVNGFGTMSTQAWSAEKTEEAYTDAITAMVREIYG